MMLMKFFSYVTDAIRTILSNKMRSWLSTLWIVIGVMSVVVLMAVWAGTQNQVLWQMSSMMQNTITISPNWGYSTWSEDSDRAEYIRKITFDVDLVRYIEQSFPELSWNMEYSANYRWDTTVKYGTNSTYSQVLGVPDNYYTLQELELWQGSWFSEENFVNQDMVAVASYGLIDSIKDDQDSFQYMIWKKIRMGTKEIKIIGILEQNGTFEMSALYLPIDTVQARLNHNNEISTIVAHLDPAADNELWQNRLTYLLLKKYNFKSADLAGFSVFSAAKFVEQLESAMDALNYLLLAIWGISLLVWGIWVMNIMIVSVTERTREIGIRKAIWALKLDIITQFLVESVIIVIIWGIIAIILSYGVVYVINKFADVTAEITVNVIMMALGLTTAIGIIFGILPAKKAADLKPIDALRFE